ncbi:metallophosphoesterase family protein [Neobacillus sp. MM2021_6]|uniref:metallophosphoesterase family protein n=1 Tax=Bacillaceae TaxID=186817 RepID=UPI0014090AC8|nr:MULTISPECIES: YfcE family phosphodiesterase [Bacillaceae]MBO0962178.1 metallophosphoesterase family protein [Neobacillus sp. MM2021_6]NHC19042.1 metallophosphoesterase family protein [Bacillus sp. MM2020_4]
MKIAFISDIHGNATALDAVLADINQRNVERIFVLGDLCFGGPEPQRSLELVNSLNAEVIKGNADEWIVRGINEGEVPDSAIEIMNKERDWALEQLDEGNVEYLRNLPTELKLEYGKVKIHACHATPHSLFEVVTPYESDQLIADKMMGSEADIYIYAHIHKPYIRYINGKCIINTGSIGLPFDGLAKSSYALLEIQEESFQTSIVRVAYDVNKVIKQFSESDYPNSEQMKKLLDYAGI